MADASIPVGPKSDLQTLAELAAKVATVAGIVLYVLGLLISNAQLMELGIADFASLQARNVLIGLCFVFYCLMLLVALVPVAFIPWLWRKELRVEHRSLRTKIAWCVPHSIYPLFAALTAALIVGIIMGFFYPSGELWVSPFDAGSYTPKAYYRSVSAGLLQFLETYWYPKIVFASFYLISAEAVVIFYLMEAKWAAARRAAMITCIVTVPSWALLMFGYADHVYPNLKYNLGGGQPQICEIALSGKSGEFVALSRTGLKLILLNPGEPTGDVARPRPADGERTETVVLEDTAIWYQSDKFIYLAQAAPSKARVVAVDVKLVRSIQHLPKYARVTPGSIIAKIEPYRSNP